MDVNPVDVQKHLKGTDYPTSTEDLASIAKNNNAPSELVERLRDLPDQQYTGPDDVQEALKRS